MSSSVGTVEIVFDGQCPACTHYFGLQRLKANGIAVRMVDAREHPELVPHYQRQGIDLDRDFVLRVGNDQYVGSEAVFVLSSLGDTGTLVRRLNRALFRNQTQSRVIYSAMRVGRRLLLLGLRRKPLKILSNSQHKEAQNGNPASQPKALAK